MPASRVGSFRSFGREAKAGPSKNDPLACSVTCSSPVITEPVKSPLPITIVGGGLAGLTLGIGLRQGGLPVTIWEAGRYPRHRVCGEFISGRGLDVLTRLGLNELMAGAGAVPATTAAFINCKRSTGVQLLPQPALCVSRFALDYALATEFQRLGGKLRQCERWKESGGEDEGIVRATGRRPQATENGWRWFGAKAHARDVRLEADLEMHITKDGYIGLCGLADGLVNVCGLFRRRKRLDDPAPTIAELLQGKNNTPLHSRLSRARWDDKSFCSVAGLSLKPKRARPEDPCTIGDAITMIPPVTGNGMSMALESAELAVEPITSWSRGDASWHETKRLIACKCDRAFRARLGWARCLHALMFAPAFQPALIRLIAHSKPAWRFWFERTR